MIIYSKTVTRKVLVGLFSKRTKTITEIYEIEQSLNLGFRAKVRRKGCNEAAQLSPKWRKLKRSAENDMNQWLDLCK